MHVSGNPSSPAPRIPKSAPEPQSHEAKPQAAGKPAHLASFRPGEKQALRRILDTPLPPDSQMVGRCLTDNGEIKTYGQHTGMQRVDIGNGEMRRTFASQESAPGMIAPRGRVASVETKSLGGPGPQGHAPAVHTLHYTNGIRQTLAQAENGELFWLGMRQPPSA